MSPLKLQIAANGVATILLISCSVGIAVGGGVMAKVGVAVGGGGRSGGGWRR